MLRRTIKYVDFNGEEREEEFLFNLTKAEIMEMELSTEGGIEQFVKQIINTRDVPKILDIFKKIVLASYGVKSADGKRFIKVDEDGRPLSREFAQTEAYSNLFLELLDSDKAAEFINGIIPQDVSEEMAKNPEVAALVNNK